MPRKIEVSHKTIIFTVIFLIGLWITYLIREIILILFVALLVMAILNPIVKKLSKFKVPKAISVLIVYFAFFGIVIVSIVNIVPPLVDQTTKFVTGMPLYISHLHISSSITNQVMPQIITKLGDFTDNVVNIGVWFVTNIVTLLTILTFAFYLLMARNKLDGKLGVFVGEKMAKEIDGFLDELEIKLGGWARGQITLMVTVGIFSYIGLSILKIPYALPLGIFAAIMEAVPYVGPIVAAVPAILIGFGISELTGIGVIALYVLIQQVENYVLVPKIMEKSVGVAPVITLLALAIGFKLAGLTGVLISVPVVITLQVLVKRKFLL